MKLRDFLVGVATGLAAAVIIKETSSRISPYVPANNVLNNIKEQFKQQAPIDGSWIYMKTEEFNNGISTFPVYRGGISTIVDGETKSYEFAADAKTGVIVELKEV